MRSLILFTLAVAILLAAASQTMPTYIHPQIWPMFAFFVVLTLIGHYLIEKALRRDRDAIMTPYLGITAFRLLASIAFVAIFLYKKTAQPYIFVINFFILYLSFLGFEIWGVLSNLRRNSPEAG